MSLTPKANASPSSPATRMGQVHRIHSFSHPNSYKVHSWVFQSRLTKAWSCETKVPHLPFRPTRPRCCICPLECENHTSLWRNWIQSPRTQLWRVHPVKQVLSLCATSWFPWMGLDWNTGISIKMWSKPAGSSPQTLERQWSSSLCFLQQLVMPPFVQKESCAH